ncbi:MAG: DUF3309 domain-containing protein [Candidatus Rokuibacteriota bacterium]
MRIGVLVSTLVALLAGIMPRLAHAAGWGPIPPIPGWLCLLIIVILVIVVIYLWRVRRRP